jgi:hypothetical protein
MRPAAPAGGGRGPEPVSYLAQLANLSGLLAAIIVLVVVVRAGSRLPAESPPRVAAIPGPAPVPAPPVEKARTPASRRRPKPVPPPLPKVVHKPLDRAAVARAEAALDAASRDRERAEARADDAARALARATAQASLDALNGKKLALRVRDPSPRLASAETQVKLLRAQRDQLQGELAALVRVPRPKARSLVDMTPVAKPTGGKEYHFEVRRNRVTFIDLDRLMDLVKSDAQLRIRLADNMRTIDAKVGPIGAFSLQYVLGRGMPQGIEALMERHGFSFDLRGWEIIPEFDGRGETYEDASRPVSAFARAINRLSPSSATITMWIYPDGFPLYRKLRDNLHARGFLVAARPLPEGMPIRGSPAGSVSAGQ